jgi:phosphopantothenoylcysteine decarboxylase/phosphopantothenate--cysteine ligase
MVTRVESARQMYDTSLKHFPGCDGAVLCAAVSDFTPVASENQKKKRERANWNLELKPTKDIAASIGEIKKENQVVAGFALETDDELENAKKKLEKKNFDFIVLNSLNDPGAGFQLETNKVTMIDKNNNIRFFELKNKEEVAKDIVDKICSLI